MKPHIQSDNLNNKQKLARLIFLVLYGVLMFVFKLAIAFLPNIEPVTVMIIALTVVFGLRSLISVYVYVLCEFFIYGFEIWNVMYLYVWAVLALIVFLLNKPLRILERLNETYKVGITTAVFTVVAGLFGLLFGLLCCIPCIFTLGMEFTVSWVVTGFYFDMLHCIGNLITTVILFIPLKTVLAFAKRKFNVAY